MRCRSEIHAAKGGAAWPRVETDMKTAFSGNNMLQLEAAGCSVDILALIRLNPGRSAWSLGREKKAERGLQLALEMILTSDNDSVTDLHLWRSGEDFFDDDRVAGLEFLARDSKTNGK